MKAGNYKEKSADSITGTVIRKRFAKGSKSDLMAVCIDTGTAIHKLKRMGGNPFSDPELEKLVGKHVEATGKLDNYQFVATNIVVVRDK